MKAIVRFAIALLLVGSVSAGNMIVNGDFETGDLYGWEEEGPSWYPWMFHAQGTPPLPAQVFSADAPMTIMSVTYGEAGIRHMRRAGIVENAAPKPGSGGKYAVGWARTDWEHIGYPWISQTFKVAPGKYLMNASWDVAAWNSRFPDDTLEGLAAAGMFMVFIDDHVDEYTQDSGTFNEVVWNRESEGKWLTESISNLPIETKTGKIEIRLQYWPLKWSVWTPKRRPLTFFPHYEWVAFDNIYVDLTPVGSEEDIK